MSDSYSSKFGGESKASDIAKEIWNKASPFPITEDILRWKVAVNAARQCKTQGEAALIYAKFGIPVFPCNSKPDKEGKLRKYPLAGEGGLYLTSTDPIQIQEWWKENPLALIGVPMGRRVGMWGVDADSKEKKGGVDGVGAWFDLVANHDPSSAVTRAHKTGTDGLHFLYLWDNDRPVGCPTMKGIGEVKGEGGYLIFPPSPYACDGRILSYSISQDTDPEPAPDWLYDHIIGPRPKSNGPWTGGAFDWSEDWVQKQLHEYCELIRTATKGHWDEARTKLVLFGRWVGGGACDVDTAWKAIEQAAKQCDAPDDYVGEVKRAFFNGVNQPLEPPKAARVDALPVSQWYGEQPAPIPPALVKGILPQTGVATIGGQSGTGKSFHAIHLGVHFIPDCKQQFYIDKYRIKRHGGVLYLVLEGKPAFPMRVTAAFEALLKTPGQLELRERFKLPFAWNSYVPNLFDKGPDNLLRLANREQKKMREEFGVDLVAIFLDTMGLAACFENENMAAQVQRVVAGLSRVSDETGALCINVDHMGKDTEAGMRGTSAKRDCVETILACYCDRDNGDKPTNHRMQLLKIRDGEEGRVIPYRLKQVDMGMDEDGERVSTAIIQWEPNRPWKKEKRKQKNDRTDVVLELALKETELPVDEDKLRQVFYRIHGGDRKAANRAWHLALKGAGFVVRENGLLDLG
jgi:hypothetical protein